MVKLPSQLCRENLVRANPDGREQPGPEIVRVARYDVLSRLPGVASYGPCGANAGAY